MESAGFTFVFTAATPVEAGNFENELGPDETVAVSAREALWLLGNLTSAQIFTPNFLVSPIETFTRDILKAKCREQSRKGRCLGAILRLTEKGAARGASHIVFTIIPDNDLDPVLRDRIVS